MEERKVIVSGLWLAVLMIYAAIMYGSCQIGTAMDHIADAVRAHQCR